MGFTDFLLLSCLGFAIAANEIVHNGTEPGINCEEPHVEHGYADAQPPYRPNDKVKFECSTGYKIKGNPTMSCEADGNWLNPPPTCIFDTLVLLYVGVAILGAGATAYVCDRSGVGARICRSLKNRRQKRQEGNITNAEQEEL